MTTPLARLAHNYLTGRVRRGELAAHTAANHRSTLAVLVAAHGNRPVDKFGAATLQRWREARAHLKPSTQCAQWSMIRNFCAWLAIEGHLPANPSGGMRAPRRPRTTPRAMPVDAVAATLQAAPDARARATIMLMVGEGLRCVEVSRLRIEDWNRRDQLIRVTGKGGHEREVAVTGATSRALDAYLAEHPATVGPLIRSYRNPSRPLVPATLSDSVAVWMVFAGVKTAARDGVGAHALRHTAASDVLDQCGDLRIVQEMLGHQHLSSTAVYLRRAGIGRMREAMEGRSYTYLREAG